MGRREHMDDLEIALLRQEIFHMMGFLDWMEQEPGNETPEGVRWAKKTVRRLGVRIAGIEQIYHAENVLKNARSKKSKARKAA
jgi:hypothetical protein